MLRPGGVVFVVVPDYLKERTFFWDVDYTHNFVTTERRVRQLFNDHGFAVERVVRSIGASTGLARDVLAALRDARERPRPRSALPPHGHRGPALQDPQEPLRDAHVRRAQAVRPRMRLFRSTAARLVITAAILAYLLRSIDLGAAVHAISG